jgi:hypothetical protein
VITPRILPAENFTIKRDGSAVTPPERPGYDALWLWFGLSRASWLTVPRVLMHAMPDDWQARMAELLAEYCEAFPNQPDLGTRVQVTALSGKLASTPAWLINYRYPDTETIEQLRSPQE